MIKNILWQNSKTQIVGGKKPKSSNCDTTQIVTKLKNWNWDQTQNLKMWQNSKSQIVTKLNSNCDKTQKSNCDKTQKVKLRQNLKTKIVTKLKNANCDKPKKNFNIDRTKKN